MSRRVEGFSLTDHSAPLNRPLRLLLRRHTSLSRVAGDSRVNPRRWRIFACCRRAGWRFADQHLIGIDHALRVKIITDNNFRFAVPARLEFEAGAMSIDSRMMGLSSACSPGQHGVWLGLGEKRHPDRRQLRRIAEHQERHAERHQVAPKLGIDHQHSSMTIRAALDARRVIPKIEAWDFFAAFAGLVDQAVDGGGALAAFVTHHQRGLAGEGGEQHLAVDRFGEVAGQRGLPVPA